MNKYLSIFSAVLVGGSLVLSGCSAEPSVNLAESYLSVSVSIDPKSDVEPIQPIPFPKALNPQKVALGDRLFHEARLSHDNTIACSSCHDLAKGGTDQAYRSIGINGQMGGINTPTVYNSGLNIRQFWDGRARTLEDQIDGPTQHPAEMGSNWPEIIGKIQKDPSYQKAFSAIYSEGITPTTIKNAIATFERSLLTTNSRFDQYLQGNKQAITDLEQKGYSLFNEYGCVACHQGANVGGNLFQKFGVFGHKDTAPKKYRNPQGKKNEHEGHTHMVKVPSLRMAVLTPPYFHDGSAATLQVAVRMMGQYQLRRQLTEEEITAIVAFLQTLSGQQHGHVL